MQKLDVRSAILFAKKYIYDNVTKDPVFICYAETRVYGWVFGWESLEYVETGLGGSRLLGNASLLVTKWGAVYSVDRRSVIDFLKNWEAENDLAYLYPDNAAFDNFEDMISVDEIDEIRKQYLNHLEALK